MSVKVEASGRRSVQLETEVDGSPDEVWQAIATGPGISSWLMPAEIEHSDGKPSALKLTFAPGVEPRSRVTTYDAPRLFATESGPFVPGAPPLATEWQIEAKSGGTCTLRIVQSLFASSGEWDNQFEGIETGLAAFLATLRIYLKHFRGQPSTLVKWMAPTTGSESEVWEKLMGALALEDMAVGQRWSAPAGVPALGGVTEYFSKDPYDALVRLDTPGSGVAAFGTVSMGGPTMVGMNLYLYGDDADARAEREGPRWQAWMQQHFPAP
jgi:hypothetical protein